MRARLLAGLFVAASIPANAADAPAPAVPLAGVREACESIGGRLGSVEIHECLDAGLKIGDGASVRGEPLMYRDYLPRSRRAVPHRVLLLGGIHGDEFSAVSVVFDWMQRLQHERFQPFYWRVIPSANPDGLLSHPATRMNAHGVDLNRNFPTPNWKADAMAYWIGRTRRDPRRYPGPSALSEPETRWLLQQIRSFHPDAIVSVHAPYGVLDYDGPHDPPQQFGYLRLHLLGTYPGSLGNYAGVNMNLPVITLELPHAGIMPTPAQSQRIWGDMLAWLQQNLPEKKPAPLYMRLPDVSWDAE
ncbi:murein peptide amidase A [Solimonas sp. C16B3]|uniref:Murein peptide amidase A n=1 Tax=Solimonas marina TaxID=2714601 RepID=A0A969W6W1_9GAMM|nr:M14 family murein peptide amidase A [Solimonas marina]NKF21043.1 murein peptide amidase A [Solimonas marina]